MWASGKFLGTRLASSLSRHHLEPGIERLFFIGAALMSLGFIATFQQTALNLALTFIIVAGMGDGIADVCLISPIQCEPDTLRLPVFSLMTLLQMTGFGVSMLIVTPYYVWLDPELVIIIFHGLPLMIVGGFMWQK
ncbi:MFS transporter [Pantoea stewartii]|uniref:hypothetical protein n=1 Tax=Pantoea stewartii TaxID=66269 RepID=UPI00249E82F6|nr:hypothetical protein [Pantoea stewartii]